VTATSSYPVENNGYNIIILANDSVVKTCTSGTNCTYEVLLITPGVLVFKAKIMLGSETKAETPSTTVYWVECINDNNCPSKDNIKGKCDSPSGTDNPDTPGYTYTCYWPACTKNDECVDNYCCDKDPAIPAADQGSGTCNWGPSSSSRIYKNKYHCDPPEWSSDIKTTSNKNIFDLILSFFSHFFQR
jgi:hypothetical protein